MPELSPPRLSDVGNTGLLTATCHALASRDRPPLLDDPLAEAIADRLAPVLAASPDPFHRRLAAGRIPGSLVVHIALRARKYDAYARDFLARHPEGTVVNLGCGLDTRFWRLDEGRLTLYDLDLPEMADLKRALVPENARYHLVGRSVLDLDWLDALLAERAGPFLFLAEGLFMYLPAEGVRALVARLDGRCPGGELAFETVSKLWLKPSLQWMIGLKFRQFGLGPGTAYHFGLDDAQEPEAWAPGIRLLDEWCYLDEPEPRIGPARHFRGLEIFRRTQWTVRYALGGSGSGGA